MTNPLAEPDLRVIGQATVEWAAEYLESLRGRPVLRPTTSAEVRALLQEPLPEEPVPFEDVLRIVTDTVSALSRHNGHPRFFGYVASPGSAIAAASAMIAAVMNVNVTSWRSGSTAAEMERLTVGWLKQMIGFPADSLGLFVSGGSMANLSALAAARAMKGSGIVYATEETHFSVRKATRLLGMGPVRLIPVDDANRMDPVALSSAIDQDRADGATPAVVAASAGTAGTGAVDVLPEIARIAHAAGLWLHVDGAYGAFAALAPSARGLFDGIAEADSVSLDPHKWLYQTVGTGCVLYRDPAAARAAFSESAEYTRVIGLQQDEAFAFWDFGPELSRPFRALPLWMMLKTVGVRALSQAIEQNLACARYLEQLVRSSSDFEMLCPVGLSIFCFRYHPPGFHGDLNALNEALLLRLQNAGSSYVSNTKVRGQFALRGCVLNFRTTQRDMEILLDDIRRVRGVEVEIKPPGDGPPSSPRSGR
jgi:aromatic-L-amino-acid decarboxylase